MPEKTRKGFRERDGGVLVAVVIAVATLIFFGRWRLIWVLVLRMIFGLMGGDGFVHVWLFGCLVGRCLSFLAVCDGGVVVVVGSRGE